MKSLRFPFFAAIAATALLSALQTEAASVPTWTCDLPSSTFQSTTSSLSSATSDAAGNTFAIIAHQGTMDVGGVPIPMPLGVQIVLINAKGKVTASGDLPGSTSPLPLSITGKKVVIYSSAGGQVTQLTIGPNATFVSTPLTFQAAGEVPSFAGAPGIERKYVYTSVSAAGKVTSLKRYSLSKLKP